MADLQQPFNGLAPKLDCHIAVEIAVVDKCHGGACTRFVAAVPDGATVFAPFKKSANQCRFRLTLLNPIHIVDVRRNRLGATEDDQNPQSNSRSCAPRA